MPRSNGHGRSPAEQAHCPDLARPTGVPKSITAMNSDVAIPNVSALAARWWMLVVRGVAAILFGILAIVAPGISLFALLIFWGAYALVDGRIPTGGTPTPA